MTSTADRPTDDRPTDDRPTDDALLADWFDEFVEDVLEGHPTDIDGRIEERPDLEERITESYLLAHRLSGRRLPTTPRIEGYEMIRELGRGGMGAVFLARHAELGRLVALKVLPTSLGLSDRARDRFLSEVRALANISDDHVVRVHNIISNGEALAFEMEFVDGPSLREVVERLRSRGRDATLSDVVEILGSDATRPPERTLRQWSARIAATIAHALARVHEAGLVHRDVKPSNILLRRDGTPLLADFGLVRETAASVTRTEAFVGTLSYASPEQLRGDARTIDERTDVYALGATLWELIVGSPPQDGPSAIEVIRQIDARGAPRLRHFVPDAPRDLETILERAMEPDPARRYQTAAELASDLELLLRWQPISARPPGPIERAARVLRRHRRVLVAGAVGAAVVTIALGAQLWMSHQLQVRTARVDELVRSAREQLLSRSTRDRIWRQNVLGSTHVVERLDTVSGAPEQGLTAALATYDRALDLDPGRADVLRERAIVATATGPDRTEVGARSASAPPVDLSPLPPLAREVAQTILSGTISTDVDAESIRRVSPDDRSSLGLLAFLIGDVDLCESAWSGLDPLATELPLGDAGLGLLYAIDGWPERAYPRLLQAARSFPDNAMLATTLASVSALLGETEAAARWLERAEELDGADVDVNLARADLCTGEARFTEAREILENLDVASVRCALRLAELDLVAGAPDRAEQRLLDLVRAAPKVVQARLGLARIALSRRDRAALLAQVEWLVLSGYCANRSAGSFRDALGILHLGGLTGLIDLANSARQSERSNSRATWTEAALGFGLFDDPRLVEQVVLRRIGHRVDRARQLSVPADGGAGLGFTRLLADSVSTWLWYPELGSGLLPVPRVTLMMAALELRSHWPWVVRSGIPSLVMEQGDGDRRLPSFHRNDGLHRGDSYGLAAALGDVDGDGFDDVAVCSMPETAIETRYVRIVSGADGSTLREIRRPGIGFSIAGIGDVDGDGSPDFATSALDLVDGGLGEAIVLVVSGADGSILHTVHGSSEDDTFGTAIAPIGDLDGDDVPDFAIGATGRTGGPGYVTVHSGRSGEQLATISGTRAASFGMAIASLGDVDGDGSPDLAVSSPSGENGRGSIYIVSIRDGRVLHRIDGDTERALFGAALASGADFDGDGIFDIVVGAPFTNGGRGAVHVFSPHDGRELAKVTGDLRIDFVGMSVTLCDVDADGVPDLVAGAPWSSARGIHSGRVVVYSGQSLAEGAPRRIATFAESGPGDMLGASVTALPDYFGPGQGAIVAGAPGARSARGVIYFVDPRTAR